MQLRPCWKTCNCVPSVGHATSPPSLDTAPPINQRSLVATMLQEMHLRAYVGHATGPSLSTPPPPTKNKGPPSCDQVRRHAVACLVWDMQLGPISLDVAPSDKTKAPLVDTKLEDMLLRTHCRTCNWHLSPHNKNGSRVATK